MIGEINVFFYWYYNIKIRALCYKEYFHADIPKLTSENLLKGQPPGTFLVRLSTTSKQTPFTITRVTSKSTLEHIRIIKMDDGNFKAKIKGQVRIIKKKYPILIKIYKGLYINWRIFCNFIGKTWKSYKFEISMCWF